MSKSESTCFCINIGSLLNKVFSFHNLFLFHSHYSEENKCSTSDYKELLKKNLHISLV